MSTSLNSKVLHASGVEIASDVSAGQDCRADTGAVYLRVTSVSNSPDTLDVTIEEYDPGNKQWFEITAFAQVSVSNTVERVELTGFFGGTLRARWVLSAGSPGYTFEVTFAGKSG